jgi:hypothetical protein
VEDAEPDPPPVFAAPPEDTTVAAANWFRYTYLAHLSRPKGNRELYRLVKRNRICRIVEIGISDMARALSLIQVAQRAAGNDPVFYTGIDWFEARPKEQAPLTLKQAYRDLRATGASVRLVPGAPASSLASAANAHQNTDLIVIGPDISENDLIGAWFYVPRMLHDESFVLNEHRDEAGQPAFTRLSRSQVADWAARESARRVA